MISQNMQKKLASFIVYICSIIAISSTFYCSILIFEEPKLPDSLLKKSLNL